MNKILIVLLWVITPVYLLAQVPSKVKQLTSHKIESRFMEIDRLQQLYIVTNTYSIQKYDTKGILVQTFNENNLGPISTLDVSNPFQILVFYREYQTVVILDRTLSEVNRIRLADLDYIQVDAIGLSSDNQLWLYDPINYFLQKIAVGGKVEFESPDLSMVLDDAFVPNRLLERDATIYLNDPDYGILIFDVFGNYLRTLQIQGLLYFQLIQDQLVWLDLSKKLHFYRIRSFQEQEVDLTKFELSIKDLQQVAWAPGRLCLRYRDRIEWYTWD